MKHFTEEELAAEYHVAVANVLELQYATRRNGKTHALNVAATLNRFANLPHAMETE